MSETATTGPAPEVEHPEASDGDRAAVAAWLEASRGRLWDTYPVRRANRAWSACLFIGRVMLDGRGLEGRAVAVRDLVQWGASASPVTASRALRDLEASGVLEVAGEARRWTVPRALARAPHGPVSLDIMRLYALTGPGCVTLAPPLRSVLWLLLEGPTTAAALSVPLRSAVPSVQRWLLDLEAAGLACQYRPAMAPPYDYRPAAVWSSVPVEHLEAVAAVAAVPVAVAGPEAMRARVGAERLAWRVGVRRALDALEASA